MKEIIEHNKKVEEINAAKKLLEAGIPKTLLNAFVRNVKGEALAKLCLRQNQDGSIQESGYGLASDCSNDAFHCGIKEARLFAACVLKLTGVITQEEIDQVKVS